MMKNLILWTTILCSLIFSTSVFAFHDGGVAHCDGCHSMHNGSGNSNFKAIGPSLTNGSDASSTCLNCHNGNGGYHIASTDGSNKNEGGDFLWVKDNDWTYHTRPIIIGENCNRGHNIVAADYGFAADVILSAAPGGSFLASDLGCTSCHDPHGQAQGGVTAGAPPISVSGSYGVVPPAGTIAGNYRILYDSNKVGFSNDAPIARANGYNGASTQYGSGMSAWCSNCHGAFFTQSATSHMHPTDVTVPATYNSYVATGNYTGDVTRAYDPLVPFERGVTTASFDLPVPTDPATAGVGVDGSSKVMCLTCHRAHASAFANALRWDQTEPFIAETWISLGSNVPATAAPYYKHGVKVDVANAGTGNPFTDGYGEFQRSLCNKCHVQD